MPASLLIGALLLVAVVVLVVAFSRSRRPGVPPRIKSLWMLGGWAVVALSGLAIMLTARAQIRS